MAPALIGNHREACPRCGYPVRVGEPAAGGTPPSTSSASAARTAASAARPSRFRRPATHRRPAARRQERLPPPLAAALGGRRLHLPVRPRRQAVRQARRRSAGRDHHSDCRRRLRQPRTPPQGARRGPRDARGGPRHDLRPQPRRLARALGSERDGPEGKRAHSRRDPRPGGPHLPELEHRRPQGGARQVVEQLRRRAASLAHLPPAHDFSLECEVEVVSAAAGELRLPSPRRGGCGERGDQCRPPRTGSRDSTTTSTARSALSSERACGLAGGTGSSSPSSIAA